MITSLDITPTGTWGYDISWTADTAGPFYVWVNGVLRETTTATTATIYAEDDDPVMIDVKDDPTPPDDVYPSRFTLSWYHQSDADRYRVEEYVDGSWVVREKIPDDGRWFFTWTSRVLEDETEHRFRVSVESGADIVGTATEVQALMVRHPNAPDASYSYDESTGELTVTSNS